MLYHDSSWLLHREHMVVVHHHYLGPLPLTLACPISGNHAKRFPHTLPLTQRPESRRDSSCPVGPRREKDKASSQCRSKAGTSATWSRQRPALAGSPRQAPGYRRLHYRLSSSRSNAGAVQQLSTGLQYPQGNFSSQQQRGVRNSPRRLPAAGAFPGSASEPCSFF